MFEVGLRGITLQRSRMMGAPAIVSSVPPGPLMTEDYYELADAIEVIEACDFNVSSFPCTCPGNREESGLFHSPAATTARLRR